MEDLVARGHAVGHPVCVPRGFRQARDRTFVERDRYRRLRDGGWGDSMDVGRLAVRTQREASRLDVSRADIHPAQTGRALP